MIGIIAALGVLAIGFSFVFAGIYGIVLSFKRHPLYGLAALVFGPFAIVVGGVKLVTGKNILEGNTDIAA